MSIELPADRVGPSELALPVASRGAKKIPAGTQVGIRWDPILLDPPPAPPALTVAPASPPPPSSPSTSASPTASPSAPPIDPPDVDLVVSEQLDPVVTLNPAVRTGKGLNVGVTYPSAPGLYRLVVTLHDSAGVAYDAPTQALVSSAIVRVGGSYTAAFGAPSSMAMTTGSSATLRRPRRQRRLPGLGRPVDHAAGRVGLAADLAAHVADRRPPRRDVGLDAGSAGAGTRIPGARSLGGGARRDRGLSGSRSSRPRRPGSTCCCWTS